MQNQNRISIYKNKKKITEKHPDLNGIIHISKTLQPGKYNVGLYQKEKDGEKYYGGTIREPEKEKPAKPFNEVEDPFNI